MIGRNVDLWVIVAGFTLHCRGCDGLASITSGSRPRIQSDQSLYDTLAVSSTLPDLRRAQSPYTGKQCYLNSDQQADLTSYVQKLKKCGALEDCAIWTRGFHGGQTLGTEYWPAGGANCLLGQRHAFIGGSMMRQVFSNMVHGLRGHQCGADHNAHLHGRYVTCSTEDAFQPIVRDISGFQPWFPSNWADPHCLNYTADYLHVPEWRGQPSALRQYFKHGARTIDMLIMLPVCIWNLAKDAIEFTYFKEFMLQILCDSGKSESCATKVLVLSCPTSRIPKGKNPQAVVERNGDLSKTVDQLRNLTAGRIRFLDFDRIVASTPGGAVGDYHGNWHYECFINPPLESWLPKFPIGVYPKEDNTCSLLQGNPNVEVLRELVQFAC